MFTRMRSVPQRFARLQQHLLQFYPADHLVKVVQLLPPPGGLRGPGVPQSTACTSTPPRSTRAPRCTSRPPSSHRSRTGSSSSWSTVPTTSGRSPSNRSRRPVVASRPEPLSMERAAPRPAPGAPHSTPGPMRCAPHGRASPGLSDPSTYRRPHARRPGHTRRARHAAGRGDVRRGRPGDDRRLAPQTPQITEIGAVKVRGGEVLGEFQTLVNPGEPIPPFISVLTGITDAMVADAPRDRSGAAGVPGVRPGRRAGGAQRAVRHRRSSRRACAATGHAWPRLRVLDTAQLARQRRHPRRGAQLQARHPGPAVPAPARRPTTGR